MKNNLFESLNLSDGFVIVVTIARGFASLLGNWLACNFKSSQASKARRQCSKCTGAKQNLTQKGHSSQWKGDKGHSNTNTNVGLIC